ncbi:carbohydrate-binding protein [Aquimarina aggregata]|uniref:carbohydrate-binding protein n=1 Tax=Aquimarina aggregata TaxID=1642818 RepID=UPI002490ACFB|nr:carbohydrate-binding protein [Aquimarina aggregata]
MKKYFYLIITLFALSCSTEDDAIPNQNGLSLEKSANLKNSSPVQLVKAWNSYSFYRGFNTWTRKFTVKVANLNYDKSVSIYHEKVDGNWEEIPLSYSMSLDNGDEIWEGQYRYYAYTPGKIYEDEFVVKYDVNNTTYWDNNNNNNYKIEEKQIGSFFAEPDLNVSVDSDFDRLYTSFDGVTTTLNIVADVRNISPTKEVQVVYTTDGWETERYFSLAYTKYWYNSYDYVLTSPNPFNVERWTGSVTINEEVDDIEYAVVYKVNGQQYWDNNYGQNYSISK